jgi:hypothetical protein
MTLYAVKIKKKYFFIVTLIYGNNFFYLFFFMRALWSHKKNRDHARGKIFILLFFL